MFFLLHYVFGPTSFDHLKTVKGKVCQTFREASQCTDVLEDNAHWDQTMQEAAVSRSSDKLRSLLAVLLSTCSPFNPRQLRKILRDNINVDTLQQARRVTQDPKLSFTDIQPGFLSNWRQGSVFGKKSSVLVKQRWEPVKSHLDIYNVIRRSYKIITLKINLLIFGQTFNSFLMR